MDLFKKCLSCPVAVFTLVIGISVISLLAAFLSEIFLGLEPCVLCIYQRWPFVIAIILGLLGLGLKDNRIYSALIGGALTLTFLSNAGIALYHTGVEQKWWLSSVGGCTVPNFGDNANQTWLENIMSAPSKSCDVIAWQDPVLGLSMANYNVALCLGMAILCAIHMLIKLKQR